MDYREFIEQLRRGFGSAAGRATQVNFYHMWCHKAADAIESLLTENERLNDELAKYRDAPCVAYATTNEEDDLAMLFFDEDEARKYSGDDEPIKLIVKPGEEK